MWIWYQAEWRIGGELIFPWHASVQAYPFAQNVAHAPSESCMMIPGTYAQMHEDYD